MWQVAAAKHVPQVVLPSWLYSGALLQVAGAEFVGVRHINIGTMCNWPVPNFVIKHTLLE